MRYSHVWIVPRLILTSCPLFLVRVCPDEVVGLKIYIVRLFPVPWLLFPIPKLLASQLADFLCCLHSFSDCGVERGRVEFASVAMRICWEGLKEGKGGGGYVWWCGLLGTSLSRGGGVGGGGLYWRSSCLFWWRYIVFLWLVRVVLWRIERWMSESVQKVIPMLRVQCVKSPGGNCPVRVNFWYHLLDIPYHALLVIQDGSARFALVVAPYRE